MTNELLDDFENERAKIMHAMKTSEKLASLGLLLAGVAHELNNPINFILNTADPLKQNIDDLIKLLKK